ncbi:MAG: ABC transporter permease [Oscillospiraceae bacterium]|nr:ABC transporter permease [Oscillospiraceae bacterium]
MIEIINKIAGNRTVFVVGVIYGTPITIALLVLFFVKSSRDERGRAIIGKASIIAMVTFILIINFVAKIWDNITINYLTSACFIQWIYDIILTVEVAAILIYKRIG